MFTTVFPIPRYDAHSDDYLTRYYEILHTIGMTIQTMVNDLGSVEFTENHLHLHVPTDIHMNPLWSPTRDTTNNKTYRQSLQTSEVLLPSDHTIFPWEKVVLRACSFTLLLCMIENYDEVSKMLDEIFLDDDTWTYFSNKRGIRTLVETLPKARIYTLLRTTCHTMPSHVHPQTWIQSNLANWIEVCGKNISSFLQVNLIPGGQFDGSQRYVCLVFSMGEKPRRYVGSIHMHSKERTPTYLVMGIFKHPMAERTCNQVNEYAGFVHTALSGVEKFMESHHKSIMWTFPLERMAVILRRRYGDFDPDKKRLVDTFLSSIGMGAVDRHRILTHPSGIFVRLASIHAMRAVYTFPLARATKTPPGGGYVFQSRVQSD